MFIEGRFDRVGNVARDYVPEKDPNTSEGGQSLFFEGNQIVGLDDEDRLLFGVLMEKGVVSNNHGEVVVDTDLLTDLAKGSKAIKKYGKWAILGKFKKYGLIEEGDLSLGNQSKGRKRFDRTLFLPDSLDGLNDGLEGGTVLEKGDEVDWLTKLNLADGTVTTPIEVFVAKKMAELNVRRENGELVYLDKDTGEQKLFRFYEHIPRVNRTTDGDKYSYIQVAVIGMPNLYGSKILEGDIRVNQVKDFSYLNVKPKPEGSADISLNNGIGAPLKYHVGREGVFGKYEDGEDDSYAVLDSWTGGYFKKDEGELKLVATFPLVTSSEFGEVLNKIALESGKSATELSASEITTSPYVRFAPASDTVRDYSVSNHVSRYSDETEDKYSERLSKLDDVANVIYITNRIFVSANINHIDLSWAKKLRLVEVISRYEEEVIIDYAIRFGLSGLNVLLMAEIDHGWSDYILNLKEGDVTELDLQQVIDVFGKLVTDEESFRQLTLQVLKNEPDTSYLADARARSIEELMAAFKGVLSGNVNINQIRLNLESEMVAKFIAFKSLSSLGHVESLEDLNDSNLEILNGATLSESDVLVMRSIYSENQAEVGAHDEILAHFDERVKDPNTKFYVFKWQGRLQSFVAFTDNGENLFEATSFNVDPAARGYKIGEAMLEEAIAREAKEHVLHGECYANLKISSKYIETGWMAEGYFTEPGKEQGTEDRLMNIYRDDENNYQYWGKRTLSKDDIYNRDGVSEFVRVEDSGSQLGLPFHLLNEGYVMTRMFYHEPARRFVGVFEPDHRPDKVVDRVRDLRAAKIKSEI